MIQLYFNPAKFPRTIKREEWREIWRWKRVTQKRIIADIEQQRQNLVAFGTTHPDIIDRIIYPPIVMHDKQGI